MRIYDCKHSAFVAALTIYIQYSVFTKSNTSWGRHQMSPTERTRAFCWYSSKTRRWLQFACVIISLWDNESFLSSSCFNSLHSGDILQKQNFKKYMAKLVADRFAGNVLRLATHKLQVLRDERDQSLMTCYTVAYWWPIVTRFENLWKVLLVIY